MDCNVVYLNIIVKTSKVNYGWEIDDSFDKRWYALFGILMIRKDD